MLVIFKWPPCFSKLQSMPCRSGCSRTEADCEQKKERQTRRQSTSVSRYCCILWLTRAAVLLLDSNAAIFLPSLFTRIFSQLCPLIWHTLFHDKSKNSKLRLILQKRKRKVCFLPSDATQDSPIRRVPIDLRTSEKSSWAKPIVE